MGGNGLEEVVLGRRTEFVETEDEDGFVDFEAEDFGLDEVEGLAIDFDEAFALLGDC